MPNIIDPVTEPSVLREPSFCMDELDFDALSSPLLQLQGKVDKKPQTAAIILAGGTGERFGKEGGKQLVEIAGKPILTWSAEAFDAVGDVGLIVIVCPEERMHEYLSRAIDPFPFVTPVVLAPSGAIRQESAFSGLEMVGDEYEYVVLHDGARPLVSPDLIEHTINMVKGNFDADGAIVAHPAVDTLKVVEDGVVVGTPASSASTMGWTVLGTYGLTDKDVKGSELSIAEGVEALKNGDVDCVFIFSAAPNSALTELSVTKDFKLLSIDEEHQKAAIEQHSYFSTATLSADLYTCTSEDTTTLAMPTLLACDSSLSNEAAYQFVKGIYENLDVISPPHAMAAKINLDHAANINLEIHPGALQYYREMGIVD